MYGQSLKKTVYQLQFYQFWKYATEQGYFKRSRKTPLGSIKVGTNSVKNTLIGAVRSYIIKKHLKENKKILKSRSSGAKIEAKINQTPEFINKFNAIWRNGPECIALRNRLMELDISFNSKVYFTSSYREIKLIVFVPCSYLFIENSREILLDFNCLKNIDSGMEILLNGFEDAVNKDFENIEEDKRKQVELQTRQQEQREQLRNSLSSQNAETPEENNPEGGISEAQRRFNEACRIRLERRAQTNG